MTSRTASPALESCEIVWWRGYVTGRFHAYAGAAPETELIAESPSIRWRSSAPPVRTEAASDALDALIERLSEAGWQVEDGEAEPWFALRLSRLSFSSEEKPTTVYPAPTPMPAQALRRPPSEPEPRLDDALLAELRAELAEARDVVRQERDRRLEAEVEVLRLKEPLPRRRPPRPLSFWVRLAAYAIVVFAAAMVGLVGFESIYGASVAALTTLAVVIAIDSWVVARRETSAAG